MVKRDYSEPGNLTYRTSCRLFNEQKKEINKIVKYAVDVFGGRKYDNESHFMRCAISNLVREELKKLEKTRGRPRKVVRDG